LFDNMSLRHKIPLRGTAVILVTALAVTGSLIYRASVDLERDLRANAESMARVLARTLTPVVIQDDVWRAFEIVRTPYQALPESDVNRAEMVLVLDRRNRVFVSTHPERYAVQSDPFAVNPDMRALFELITSPSVSEPVIQELDAGGRIYVVAPLAADGVRVATLVMAYSTAAFAERFESIVRNALLMTLIVLALILPVSWYWGHRMALPLVRLAEHMRQMARRTSDTLAPRTGDSRDEIRQVAAAYDLMVAELRTKEALEKQMMQSERLAALGRLSAGIAHEINNPLGGMLNAISTLRRHGGEAPPQAPGTVPACAQCGLPGSARLTQRTVSLLERGLLQIKETIAALLVEARVESHPLSAQDIEDTHTLVLPDAQRKGAQFVWDNRVSGTLRLPSTLVRQILLNLLLNAVEAVAPGGKVECRISTTANTLEIEVANDGQHIPDEEQQYLFEPFSRLSLDGHGLGLWVTYQIVQQLGGQIRVRSRPGDTRFEVTLPVEIRHEERTTADAVPG
jgi:two-component system, NtrC family, sensor kinase